MIRTAVFCAGLALAGSLVWTVACGTFLEATSDADASTAPADANAPSDGGSTTSDAPFACPQGAFCDDFERDSVRGNWTNVATFEGGVLEIDSRFSTTPTRSVRATADGRGSDSRACMQQQAARTDGATIEFDARFEDSAAGVQLVGFTFAKRKFLELLFSANGTLVLAEQTYPDGGTDDLFREAPPFAPPPPGEWRRYSLRFDRTAKKVWGTVGMETRELDVSPSVLDEVFETICVGVAYVENRLATVWIDNVIIR